MKHKAQESLNKTKESMLAFHERTNSEVGRCEIDKLENQVDKLQEEVDKLRDENSQLVREKQEIYNKYLEVINE